jgi:polysaccharide biosynthesis transport protein
MELRHEADEQEARLADLVSVVRDTVRRRWLTLVLVAGAVLIAGVVAISFLTPIYTATARIRLDPTRNPLVTASQANKTELSDEAIQTEVSAIRSPDLARAVVKKLDLTSDPELAGDMSKAAGADVATAEGREAAVVNAVLSRITVERERQTYILDVHATSVSAAKAARIANAFAQAYVEYRLANRTSTAENQSEWFQQRLKELGEEARVADARVADFRARAGLAQSAATNSSAGTITDQQVAPVSANLASAESDAASARAGLAQARAQVSRGRTDTVSEVLNNNVISDLRRQRAEVIRTQADTEARYGERHPESVRIREQLAALDDQIAQESNRVVASLQSTANTAEARAGSLRGTLGQLERQRSVNTRNAVLADSLEREAQAKRQLYDRMSQLSLQSMQAARASFAQVEVADQAKTPSRPTSPNKPLLYALTLLAALGAGGATVAVQELTGGGFRSTDQIERQLGIPVLAAVPKVARGANPADVLLDKPTSMFAEALRIARAAVLGQKGQAPPKIVAVTSALPSEGKTTSAVSFARTMAIAGGRTLLIECDVRRAAVRKLVRHAVPAVGLVEVLHDEATLEEAIVPGDVANLDEVLVLEPYFSAENLFGGGKFEAMLDRMRDRYDHIILDLPPLMGLADGRALAVLADAVVMIVKWQGTPVSAATAAVNWLRSDGANPVGAMYTMVDSSAQNVGGLYYYSKQYSEYYQSA